MAHWHAYKLLLGYPLFRKCGNLSYSTLRQTIEHGHEAKEATNKIHVRNYRVTWLHSDTFNFIFLLPHPSILPVPIPLVDTADGRLSSHLYKL